MEVGDVDEKADARALDQLGEELPFRELVLRPGEERRDVLQGKGYGQQLLGDTDVLAEDVQRVPGAGHRQQVPGFDAGDAVSGPPDPTKAMCSVTSGAPSASARSARATSLPRSGRSAPPRPSETPCGTTGVPRSHSRRSGGEVSGADVLRHDLHPVDALRACDVPGDFRAPADARTP
ncbi:hypothetical protein GCM10020000_07610 [Streptomyces olivoverticillatus]